MAVPAAGGDVAGAVRVRYRRADGGSRRPRWITQAGDARKRCAPRMENLTASARYLIALRLHGMAEQKLDLAYYYPQPYWPTGEVDTLKNLLLFFDGIAILLPRYMSGRETAADPILAVPLQEKGLLRILEPETFVDQEMTEALIAAVTELVTEGAFDNLARPEYGYAELSRSRMGWNADIELSEMITEELIARDLARPSEDGVSVPLHPVVRTTFLVLLSQLAPRPCS
jgi:hypothetical protein